MRPLVRPPRSCDTTERCSTDCRFPFRLCLRTASPRHLPPLRGASTDGGVTGKVMPCMKRPLLGAGYLRLRRNRFNFVVAVFSDAQGTASLSISDGQQGHANKSGADPLSQPHASRRSTYAWWPDKGSVPEMAYSCGDRSHTLHVTLHCYRGRPQRSRRPRLGGGARFIQKPVTELQAEAVRGSDLDQIARLLW